MIDHYLAEFAGRPVYPFDPAQGIAHPNAIYRISSDWDDPNWADHFAQFVADPRAREARGVVIGAWMGDDVGISSEQAVRALVRAAPQLPHLQAIFLGDILAEEAEISWIIQSDLSPIFGAYPALTHFGVRGGERLKLGHMDHANLTTLIVETGGLNHQVVVDILNSNLPQLRHLELYIGTDEYGRTTEVAHLEPLLAAPTFPNLRYLGLRDAENADAIATAVANAPILDQLHTLDLSLGTLTDEGGRALLRSPRIQRLQTLDLHFHYLSDEMMAQLAALPMAVDVSHPQEEDRGTRYVAVGE